MTALHELLHAAGLQHEDNTYAIMNSTHRPWRNDSPDQQMRPLPDDRRGLRRLYPINGSEQNVGLTNTYVDVTDLNNSGAARGDLLCQAAAGGGFSSGMFTTYCSQDSFVTVCPGDRVYTRFTINNDSTFPTTVTERLYFSSDYLLSAGDRVSPSTWIKTLDAGRHFRAGHSFAVPAGLTPGATYRMILEVESDLASETSLQDNWIPAGSWYVKGGANCP